MRTWVTENSEIMEQESLNKKMADKYIHVCILIVNSCFYFGGFFSYFLDVNRGIR